MQARRERNENTRKREPGCARVCACAAPPLPPGERCASRQAGRQQRTHWPTNGLGLHTVLNIQSAVLGLSMASLRSHTAQQ
jgi:hypothetical protein